MIAIGDDADYTKNTNCAGGPFGDKSQTNCCVDDNISNFGSTTPLWKYGGEHWCNLQGRYVTLYRDFSDWSGAAFDLTICNFNIYGGKYKRATALPAKITVEQGASYTLAIPDLTTELIYNTVDI